MLKDIKAKYKREYFDFASLLRSKSEMVGLWSSVFAGEGGDISHIRPYEPGDKLRNLHRPSLAREEFFVKEFFGERRASVWIVLDMSASLAMRGEIEIITAKAARSGAALFSAIVCGAVDFWDIKIGSMLLGGKPAAKQSATNGRRCLDFVLDSLEKMRFERAIFFPNMREARGSLIFFASDFSQDARVYSGFFAQCARFHRAEIIPVYLDTSWIWEGFESSPAELAGIDVLADQNVLILADQKNAKQSAERGVNFARLLKRNFAAAKMTLLHLQEPVQQKFVQKMNICFYERQRILPQM